MSGGACWVRFANASIRWLATPAVALALHVGAPGAWAQTPHKLTLSERDVTLDVFAATGPVRGAAILVHGFTRSRTTLGGHAAALASVGIMAVTPDMPYTFDFQRNAQALAELVNLLRTGSELGPETARVVLVGFSAGALSSLLAAGTPGVVGYVGLDPFDRSQPDGKPALGLAFAPKLKTQALLLRAPPSRCNAQGVAAPWAQALPALRADQLIPDASHCDFEAPSDWICALACGSPDQDRQTRVRDALLGAMDHWLPRAAP